MIRATTARLRRSKEAAINSNTNLVKLQSQVWAIEHHKFGEGGTRVGGVGDLTEVEQQLLMAAGVHGLGPATDLGRANTARVVNQVLRWRGLTAEQIDAGWQDEDCDPEHDAVYAALVRMTHQDAGTAASDQASGRGRRCSRGAATGVSPVSLIDRSAQSRARCFGVVGPKRAHDHIAFSMAPLT